MDPEEREPDDRERDRERERQLRRLSGWVQAGALAFLGVATLGLLPGIVATVFPAAGPAVTVAVWVVAPAVPIVLLVVAALRFPR